MKRLIEGQSTERIEKEGPPLRRTIRRWTNWMLAQLETLRAELTKLLIKLDTEYFSVSSMKETITEKYIDLLDKGKRLAPEEEIIQFGVLSYIKYNIQINS